MSDNSTLIETDKLDALALVEELRSRNKMGIQAQPAVVKQTAMVVSSPTAPLVEMTQEEIDMIGKPTFADHMIDNVAIGQQLNIVNIPIPERMKYNISTGHEKIDILMAGDGVTPSTVCLLTGTPGSGKSTLAAQLADCITSKDHIALYNMCEESLIQLAKTAKRLRIQNGFDVSSHRNVFGLSDHANAVAENNPGKQVFLFVDSLQTLDLPHVLWDDKTGKQILDASGKPIKAPGRQTGHQTAEVLITKILACWAKSTYGIVFLVGQVNKDGEMAGRQAIKHWIDVHMHLSIVNVREDGKRYSERICEITKNRFGIANIFFPFELEARGVKFLESKPKK